MDDKQHPLDFAARQAAKRAERKQIAEELRHGVDSPERIARNHQPLLALGPQRAHVRLDLARSLA